MLKAREDWSQEPKERDVNAFQKPDLSGLIFWHLCSYSSEFPLWVQRTLLGVSGLALNLCPWLRVPPGCLRAAAALNRSRWLWLCLLEQKSQAIIQNWRFSFLLPSSWICLFPQTCRRCCVVCFDWAESGYQRPQISTRQSLLAAVWAWLAAWHGVMAERAVRTGQEPPCHCPHPVLWSWSGILGQLSRRRRFYPRSVGVVSTLGWNFIQLNILHLTESFSSLNYVAFTFRYFFPNFPPFFFWPFCVFSDHCPSAVPTTAASLQLLLPFLWLLHYNCLKCCFFPRHLPAH